MPSSIRVAVCASLLVSAAACQKAEFDKPQPQALVVTLSSGLISADDGTISVSVAAVEDGSPVLNESVTATIGGACAAAPQTLDTSPTSGLAVFDFTGLDSAGGCTVTVTARALTEVANFEVAAGAPATIALAAVGATAIQAGESVGYSVVINDAAANDVSVGVSISTDAPGSINNADGTIDFTIAGSWQVFAEVIGFPALTGTDNFGVTVTAAGAAQVTTTLLQSSVGQQQTLDLTCAQFDAFGNLIANDFTAADVSTNPAASNVVEDANTPNLFHISGFPTFGIFVATCDAGALFDDETFSVGQQAGASSAIATADLAQIEAGTGVISVTCREVDGFGNDLGSTFDVGTGFTTTAVGTVSEPSPNLFTVSGVAATGSFSATCISATDTDSENFAVVDSTAPAVQAFSVSGGTGPHPAGTIVSVNLDVTDVIGVATESLIISGPGEIVSSPTLFETTADPPSRSFQVRLNGSTGVSTTVTVQGQAADTTGNLRVTSTIGITVNAAPTLTTATVSTSNVEAGSTLVVTCNEVSAVTGSSASTNFAAANVSTTASGETIVEQGGAPNNFDVTGLLTKGTFVATCAGVADSGDATFAVVDTTPPTQDAFSVTGGTGPYAAGTTVTVNLDVQDLVGVASESLVIVSGPGVITSPSTILETTANPPSRTFQVRLEGTVGSASTVTVRGQAADTTGNLLTTSTIAITVNAAPTTTTAMVSVASVEAGSTLQVTCNEFNAVTGSSANTNFAAGNVGTTAVGESIAETTPTSNVFNVTGLLTKGSFVATCTGAGSSGNASFAVVDTTPPTLDAFSVTGGNGPYAAGTVVTVNLDVQDLVGVASESLVIASGPGVITSPSTVLESTTNPPSRSFQVRLDGSVGASSTVTVRGQAADTTGNLLITSTIDISVNAIGTAVVTTLSGTSIQYDQTLDLTCKQVNSTTGADTGTVFVVGDVSSTAPGLSSITSLGGNAFRLTGPFTAKGNFTATCTKSAQSNVKTFAIFDATAPTVGTLSVFAATGVNGITGDTRYAPGTVVTVRLSTANDTIGLAQVDVSAIGTASVNPATRFVSGVSATNIDFDVTVGASAATFSTIVITAQASDTTGNTSAASGSLTLTVDPAVALTAASGVTIRTLFETKTGAYPAGLGTDGTDLFVQRRDATTGFIADVVRISGTNAPAALSNVINTGFPASTFASGGITGAAGGFGSPTLRTVFHTFGAPNPQIGAENGTSHTRFDTGTSPVDPTDVVFGDIGPGARVFTIDRGAGTGGFTTVLKSINTGGTVPYFQTTGSGDTIGGTAPNMTLTDAGASFTLQDVGQSISINGATNAANNGTFVISAFTNSTTITYQNGSGVAEAFPGAWAISTRIEDCRALTRDASLSRLLIADPSGTSGGATGAIHVLTDTGGDVPNPITSLTLSGSIPANDASDIATSPTKIVIAGGATGAVYRVVTATSTVETPVSVEFDLPIGLAVKSADANSLHVLDAGAVPGGWRIYKVTGY